MKQLPEPFKHYTISEDGKTIIRAPICSNNRIYPELQVKIFKNHNDQRMCMLKDNQSNQGMRSVKHVQALANGIIRNFDELLGKRINLIDKDKSNVHINNLKLIICKKHNPSTEPRKKRKPSRQETTGVIRLKPGRYAVLTNEYRHLGTYTDLQDAKDSLETYNKYGCILDKIIKREISRGLRRETKTNENTI